MKLASLRSGRDGILIVVSRDLAKAVKATGIADTMQYALDNWQTVEPALQALYKDLNTTSLPDAFALQLEALSAPLPRSYQFLDGAAYASHIKRNRQARGETVPEDFYEKPLMYQGTSHGFMAWNQPVPLPDDHLGIDFEAEIFAVTDDVPMGRTSPDASRHIKLFVLVNDISLRSLIPPELKRTFGFLTGKPSSSMGPIAVTPDELGPLWDGRMVSGNMKCWVRGELVGSIETGIDSAFHYGDLIAHVAQTRTFEPGTLVGLGTVSNEDEQAGCGCIGEIRALETLKNGTASTPFLRFGETVRIEHFDRAGYSVFGCIEQTFVKNIEPAGSQISQGELNAV